MRMLGREAIVTGLIALFFTSACSPKDENLLHKRTLKLYYFEAGGSNLREVPPGFVIPYKISSCYGWRLTFDPIDAQIPIEELLLLPDRANEWNVKSSATVANDRMSGYTKLIVSGHKGSAEHSWCIAPGDPLGKYKFVIKQNQAKIGELTFTLVD